jgi:hypothetical protein
MFHSGIETRDFPIRTKNFMVITDLDFNPISEYKEMRPSIQPYHTVQWEGIEDLRMFIQNDSISYIGTSAEYSHDGSIKQVIGSYDIDTASLGTPTSLHSPTNAHIEKNWIPLPTSDPSYIYEWHPFKIYKTSDTSLVKEQQTPNIFKHMRGSTPLFLYNSKYYCFTHLVIESVPRKYYHSMICLDGDFTIVEYSIPFYFLNNSIEYTLGFVILDGIVKVIISQMDRDPMILTFKLSTIPFRTME